MRRRNNGVLLTSTGTTFDADVTMKRGGRGAPGSVRSCAPMPRAPVALTRARADAITRLLITIVLAESHVLDVQRVDYGFGGNNVMFRPSRSKRTSSVRAMLWITDASGRSSYEPSRVLPVSDESATWIWTSY